MKRQKDSAQVEAELVVCFDRLLKLRLMCFADWLVVRLF